MAEVDVARIERGAWAGVALFADDVDGPPMPTYAAAEAVETARQSVERLVFEEQDVPMTPAQQEFASTATTLAVLHRRQSGRGLGLEEIRDGLRRLWPFIDGRWRP